jgi:hypothetical protein
LTLTTLPVLTRFRSAGALRDRQVHTVDGGPLTSPACFCAIAACREDKPLQNAQHEKAPGRFGFFEFALVGVPLVLGTIAIVVLFGERLLPHRSSRTIPRDFSDHARTLVEQYALTDMADTALTRKSGVAEVDIPPRSELAGKNAFPGMVTDSDDLVVLAEQRRGEDLGPRRPNWPLVTRCWCTGRGEP